MPSQYSISNIVTFMEIAQFNTASQLQKLSLFNSRSLDSRYSRKLYLIRKAVDFMNNNYPQNSTLRKVAEYGFALAKPYNIAPATIGITNPVSLNLNVGDNAVFQVSVSVSNGAAFTIQWYRNGVIIPGATSLSYQLSNVQLSDNGATFKAIATAIGVGSAASASATLTVTALIVGYYYFGATDYSSQLLAGNDVVPYVGTFPITHGQPLSILLPQAAANTFMVFKYPASESIKTNYSNLPINVGVIPSIAWNAVVTFGGWNYIFTRAGNTFGLNYLNPLVFS